MWKLKIAEGGGPWLRTVNNFVGRQHWEFDPDAGTPAERAEVERVREEFKKNRFKVKQSADLLMRMQLTKENPPYDLPPQVKLGDNEIITEEALTTTSRRAMGFYSTIQAHDGHWPAESAGPLFFLPPLVFALYITRDLNTVMTPAHQMEIKRYIYNHQNEDGGWGLHIMGHSTMFGSVFSYITLRLLGEGPDDGEDMAMARGRQWILDHGGMAATPSWGKMWLSVLGVYEWSGCNPVPPEFWLLPKSLPIQPSKMLCYCRLVYMPMSYLYGKRFVGPITSLILSLREELYIQPYHEINWDKQRNSCAKEDLYYPHPLVQDMLWAFLHKVVEPILATWPFSKLREKAIKIALEHIDYEDKCSRYMCIGCVEKIMCMLTCWVEDPNSDAYKLHIARLPDYYWVAEDGLKMQSFGCQMWDAGFAVQALLSSNLTEEFGPTLRKAHDFVKASQVRDNPAGDYAKMYRHTSKGAWTFSNQDHGWQVSDCTSEGLKCCLMFSQMNPDIVGEKMETERMYDSVNVILSLQSSNGGFPAWEPQRAYRWLELFNPTEFFEDVVIEREYVECTSSVVQALALFRKLHPKHRRKEIDSCIYRAIKYIEDTQNPDGSWYGCWAICYTNGTWFAVEALAACGRNYHNSPTMRKACQFLLSKQLPCGGWGESYLSCTKKVYTNVEGNRPIMVQTAWALLALIDAGQAEVDPTPIHRGMRPSIFVVQIDNVGSNQLHQIRVALRGKGVVLMGKNTMVRRALRGIIVDHPQFEKLLPFVKGNIGFVFTSGDLKDIREIIVANKVAAPARPGAVAPNDVFVPAGNTGMEPGKTSFFQALQIPTKIARGTIEIVNDVKVLEKGVKVGTSEATLLNMLNISPFTYGMVVEQIFSEGNAFSPEILDVEESVLLDGFLAGIKQIATISLATGYPTIASVGHSLVNSYKNLLNISLATDYEFDGSKQIKEYLANPEAFAAAAPAAAAATDAPAAEEAKEDAKADDEEGSDDDMGFGLFD